MPQRDYPFGDLLAQHQGDEVNFTGYQSMHYSSHHLAKYVRYTNRYRPAGTEGALLRAFYEMSDPVKLARPEGLI